MRRAGLDLLCCCLPFNLAGLVLGIIALIQMSALSTPREGRGMAIAGVILSATNLLWCLGLTALNMATNQARLMQTFN